MKQANALQDCLVEDFVMVLHKSIAKAFLRLPGTSVTMQICPEGPFVKANKQSFDKNYLGLQAGNGAFIDAEGNPRPAFTYNKVLHVYAGTL